MMGWGWQSVHHADHVDRVVAKLKRCYESGQDWEDTFPLRSAHGEYRWFLSRAIRIIDAQSNTVRWFGTNTDITDLREAEAKLVEADRQKDEFISMLGHELKNPLAAIRNVSDYLHLHKGDKDNMEQMQQILDRQTNHMMKLIDGLLDISRVIHGKISLDMKVVDLAEICRNVLADLGSQISTEQKTVICDVPDTLSWIKADVTRINQIISNLLYNAAKFTADNGWIKLSLIKEKDSVEVRVQDNGIGIDTQFLPHMFDLFRQHKQSIDRSSGGLGLGLALVKTLTGLQGGEVYAKSDGVGFGATFVVRLPLTDAPDIDHDSIRAPNTTLRASIVLIEDNEDAGMVLQELLQVLGHDVVLCTTGAQGIEQVREIKPDLVICDIGLPGGFSGFDVAKELRSDPLLNNLRLAALTGYGKPDDIQMSLAAGFDFHLTKPVDVAKITDLLTRMS